jgi:hypothetical protein
MQYSESEAAYLLGISVEQLRLLVNAKIFHGEAATGPIGTIRASDLALLRILNGMFPQAKTVVH